MAENKSDRSLTQILVNNQIRDLSSKKESLEEEIKNKEILLIHLEKLSSVGQFIREIVHELKNPLSAISGFAELCKMAKTEEDREAYLNKIPGFINQITSRLSQFRSMTLNSGITHDKIDLIPILAECLSTLELLKPKGATIESSFKTIDLNIMGDKEQWIQVFLGISRTFFNYMKEMKSTLIVNSDILSAKKLSTKDKEISLSLLDSEERKKSYDRNSNWINIEFANRKISIPKEKLKKAIHAHKSIEDLNKLEELGLVIACDVVLRHQGNIYLKKTKSNSISLNICVPKID